MSNFYLYIECPAAEDGMERFSCPSPDRMGRYRCIDDHVLCDGFIDCPNGEDEDRMSCMFYKTVSLSIISFKKYYNLFKTLFLKIIYHLIIISDIQNLRSQGRWEEFSDFTHFFLPFVVYPLSGHHLFIIIFWKYQNLALILH